MDITIFFYWFLGRLAASSETYRWGHAFNTRYKSGFLTQYIGVWKSVLLTSRDTTTDIVYCPCYYILTTFQELLNLPSSRSYSSQFVVSPEKDAWSQLSIDKLLMTYHWTWRCQPSLTCLTSVEKIRVFHLVTAVFKAPGLYPCWISTHFR